MNKLFVVGMVKNEEDIIYHNLNYLLTQDVDHFIISNNLSTDSTDDILHDFKSKYPDLFTILQDNEIGYFQSIKMNKLIYQAASAGATHIIPLDADEFWFTYSGNTLGFDIKNMNVEKTFAKVFDMVPKDNCYQFGDNPLEKILYQEPLIKALPSVAFKFIDGCSIIQGNHDVIMNGSENSDILYIKHYQYRTFEQFKFKLRNGKVVYDATNLPEGFGGHWRSGGSLSDDQLLIQWNSYIGQSDLIFSPSPRFK